MPHECETCGSSFETLTRLRLHDCSDTEASVRRTQTTTDTSEPIPDITSGVDRVFDGEPTAIFDAMAAFESAISERGSRNVFWDSFERVSDALATATEAEGWDLLGEVVSAYHPATSEELPSASPVIANAVGRFLIRTRVNNGVEAIPADSLMYLDTLAVEAPDGAEITLEETHAYGWGIGHPDHPVGDRLHERASVDIFQVRAALEHAFYADQVSAVALLERLVEDETIDQTVALGPGDGITAGRYLLDAVYGLPSDDRWPRRPRYWDWPTELDYEFELDPDVERRIRALVTERGLDDGLPTQWTLRDLGL